MKTDDLILRNGPITRIQMPASRAPQDEVNFERGRF